LPASTCARIPRFSSLCSTRHTLQGRHFGQLDGHERVAHLVSSMIAARRPHAHDRRRSRKGDAPPGRTRWRRLWPCWLGVMWRRRPDTLPLGPAATLFACLNGGTVARVALADEQLVAALRAGDEDAFRTVVREWHASLLRVAQIFTPSRAVAEEVVQETWL